MEILGSKDYVSLSLSRPIGNDSFETLGKLYLPILGSTAMGVYQGLFALAGFSSFCTGEDVVKFLGVSYQQFEDSSKALEALGLLRSYLRQDNSQKVYSLFLYPPLSPQAFLNHFLLSSLLEESVGKETMAKIRKGYSEKGAPKGAEDVSTSFRAYFRKSGWNEELHPLEDQEARKILDLGFDVSALDEELSSRGYSSKMLSPEEKAFLEEVAAFYGYSSATIAQFAAESLSPYKPLGEKLLRPSFLKKCREGMKFSYLRDAPTDSALPQEKDELAKKIALMDRTPPAQFLSIKQGFHKPAEADLKLVERLRLDLGLPGPCVNAVIDYVLGINDNVLSAPLCEKLAALLVRKKLTNARDAMEALLGSKSPKKKSEPKPVTEDYPDNIQETKKDEEISDEELDALFDNIYSRKDSR
ncbi:MAG: hypothetical protein SOV58_02850 [Candidatus Enteromonas sp.]|nr:hypothetical protein [Candidatus Enteromonas sp.]